MENHVENGHEPPGKPSPRILDLLAMGLALALMVSLGLVLGLVVDSWLHSSPWGALGGLAFGVVAAVGSVVRQVRRYL